MTLPTLNEIITATRGMAHTISFPIKPFDSSNPDPFNCDLKDLIIQILNSTINRDANPGFPLNSLANTNAQLIDNSSNVIVGLVMYRLHCILSTEPENFLNKDGRIHIARCLIDPIRLFIKQELHSEKKLKDKRYRLIWSVSIIDQVIDRLLFRDLISEEIDYWQCFDSKGGAGLSLDSQATDLFNNIISKLGNNFITSDVSNWDWSFRGWMFISSFIKVMIQRGYGDNTIYHFVLAGLSDSSSKFEFMTLPPYVRACWARIVLMSHPPIGLSNGQLLQHGSYGIMKSGWLKTLETNSFCRSLLNRLICNGRCTAMGDDSAETTKLQPDELISRYQQLGIILTDVTKVIAPYKQGIEFCSHQIYPSVAIPLNEIKILVKYLNSPLRNTIEQWMQIKNDLRHSKNSKLLLKFISSKWEVWANEVNQESSKENQEDTSYS